MRDKWNGMEEAKGRRGLVNQNTYIRIAVNVKTKENNSIYGHNKRKCS